MCECPSVNGTTRHTCTPIGLQAHMDHINQLARELEAAKETYAKAWQREQVWMDKHKDVMAAAKRGEPIQVMSQKDTWHDCDGPGPSWSRFCLYRVKPRPDYGAIARGEFHSHGRAYGDTSVRDFKWQAAAQAVIKAYLLHNPR